MNDNNEQAVLWNGSAGQAWVETQEVLDQAFQPFADLLLDHVIAASQRRAQVLDVGCGSGTTTLAFARALGAQVVCTGVDISAPLIRLARARAEREGLPVEFIEADAQSHPLAAGRYDFLVSRFGIMFFADPETAFANLRRAAVRGARLLALAWRHPDENPFMTTAERAAGLLPVVPPRARDAPGQFAFADRQRVADLLSRAGWQDVALVPIDTRCGFPAAALDDWLTRLGPVGRVFANLNAAAHAELLATLRPAFNQYVQGDRVIFDAACWQISARAPV